MSYDAPTVAANHRSIDELFLQFKEHNT